MPRLILLDIDNDAWQPLCSGLFQLPGGITIGSIKSVAEFVARSNDPDVCGFVFFCDHSRGAQSIRVMDPDWKIVFIHAPDAELRLNGPNTLLVSRAELADDPLATAERVRSFLYSA